MQLFYTPSISSDFYTLSAEESKHCVQVLRLKTGDTIYLIDGRGGLYTARITEASARGCVVNVVERQSEYEKRPYELHVAIAPTKNIDRFEWFLEKATEIGIDRVTPLLCDHSERKILKTERCEKVVLSAAKQSLKAYLPQVDELTKFSAFIGGSFEGYQKYIAHCEHDIERVELSQALESGGKSVVLIGPEGDFSPAEIEQAMRAGFKCITLGKSRLRTETAGVMTAAICSMLLRE